ncbi:MAG: DNRLRE domain-containing protein [Mucilaginibacter sp.]|nr:DNRLRE domain-containing protein [Mucilaginibacter sp.]
MKNNLPQSLLVLTVLAGFASCKKAEYATPPVVMENTSGQAHTQLFAADDQFSALTWGMAKPQPTSTHEIQGEVVNGKLYIFGGFDVNKRPQWTPTKRAYVYDPIKDSWASIKSLPHEPYGSNFGGGTHVAVATDGKAIYLAGGYTSNAAGTGQIFGTKQVWRYNVATNDYTRFPDLPEELGAGQLRYLNGKLHYIGGAKLSRSDTKIHLALDLADLDAGWRSRAPLLNAVNHPGAAVFNGKIYIFGGSHNQNEASVPQKTVQVYDEVSNVWTTAADMPIALDHILSSVVVYGNRIIVLGGQTAHNTPGKQILAYDPLANTWSELAPMRAKKSAGVAAVFNGNIYYTGGNFSAINYKGVPVVDGPGERIAPVADAFVRDGSFSLLNYGADTSLVVKGSKVSNYQRTAYLKFSLANISSVNAATLRLYGRNIDNSNTINLSLFGLENDSWSENGIAFNNAPQPAAAAISSAALSGVSSRIEFDVTAFIKAQVAGDRTASFLIKDVADKNATVLLNSKENLSNTPELVIR